ncbi:hypothetical protein FACS1894110_15680 [Spirochaetia bacterium]|nr:hypothetical protein FACS1894110_15680 [Spirochaetia bacterium]
MDNAIRKFWEHEFGSSEIGYDFAGWEIRKGAYGQEGSRFGWNVDHILPKSMGGTDDVNNLQITHMDTNAERGNKITFWLEDVSINGRSYQVSYQVKRVSRIGKEDNVVNYNNHYNGKKYCIVIVDYIENVAD